MSVRTIAGASGGKSERDLEVRARRGGERGEGMKLGRNGDREEEEEEEEQEG